MAHFIQAPLLLVKIKRGDFNRNIASCKSLSVGIAQHDDRNSGVNQAHNHSGKIFRAADMTGASATAKRDQAEP